MNRVLYKYINIRSRIFGQRQTLKILPASKLLSTTNSFDATSEEAMTKLLRSKFPEAKRIKVEDVSGGCGAMYNIYVETKDFKGLSVLKQHKSIYDALKEQIQHIHGLQIETKVPP